MPDDRPKRKVPMSRLSPPDFPAFISRLSCVQQTFVRSCPDLRASTRFLCAHPIFVRSYPNFREFNRLSCVHGETFVRSSDRSCVHVQTFVLFFRVSRLCKFERTKPPSCVHLRLDISTFRLGPQPRLRFKRSTNLFEAFPLRICNFFRSIISFWSVHLFTLFRYGQYHGLIWFRTWSH